MASENFYPLADRAYPLRVGDVVLLRTRYSRADPHHGEALVRGTVLAINEDRVRVEYTAANGETIRVTKPLHRAYLVLRPYEYIPGPGPNGSYGTTYFLDDNSYYDPYREKREELLRAGNTL